MTNSDTTDAIGDSEESRQEAPQLPMLIHSQFIKDLSFESPNAPFSMRPNQAPPEMDIDINLDVKELEDPKRTDFFEVSITLRVTAMRPEQAVFVAELVYAAAVSLNGVPKDKQHPILMVQAPHYMYPYARAILSNVIQSAGFPPLMLNPVNFREMYIKRFGAPQNSDSVQDEPVSTEQVQGD